MSDHAVGWRAPVPTWADLVVPDPKQTEFRRPMLLRVEGANFFEQLTRGDLKSFLAPHESWETDKPLRFYMVVGSLVCQLGGLPDHRVRPEDTLGFVLRWHDKDKNQWFGRDGKLGDPLEVTESDQPDEPPPVGSPWSGEPLPLDLAWSEELLPLFPLPCRDGGVNRLLRGGILPVSRLDVQITIPQTDRWRARLVYRRVCTPFSPETWLSAPSLDFQLTADTRSRGRLSIHRVPGTEPPEYKVAMDTGSPS